VTFKKLEDQLQLQYIVQYCVHGYENEKQSPVWEKFSKFWQNLLLSLS